MVVAAKPTHMDPNSLSIELDPMYDDVTGLLGGFLLQLSGEVDVTLPMPPSLNRADLGKSMTIRIVTANYGVPRHCLLTRYKSAQALVEQGLLSFSTTTQSASKETRSSLILAKDATLAA